MMSKITLDRPNKKNLGSVNIIAMKRNPKNGKIVNQEWWDYEDFRLSIESLVHRACDYGPVMVGYSANRVPRWMRWLLGEPNVWRSEYVNFEAFRRSVDRIVVDRLEEDRNRSRK